MEQVKDHGNRIRDLISITFSERKVITTLEADATLNNEASKKTRIEAYV